MEVDISKEVKADTNADDQPKTAAEEIEVDYLANVDQALFAKTDLDNEDTLNLKESLSKVNEFFKSQL
jgi:hypothetical protein